MSVETTTGSDPDARRKKRDTIVGIAVLALVSGLLALGYSNGVLTLPLPEPSKPPECASYSMNVVRGLIKDWRARLPLIKTKSLDTVWEVRDGQCFATDLGDNGIKISFKVATERFNGTEYVSLTPDLSNLFNGLLDQ